MKKILALTLAAVMAAGMSTVAFAANDPAVYLIPGGANWMFVDADDDGQFGGSGDVKYLVDTGSPVTFGREDGGSKVAFPLWYADGTIVTEKDDVKGLKVKGIMRGYAGLLEEEIVDMNSKSVSDIINRGGTILYTARCQEFTTPEGQQKGAEICRKHHYSEYWR